MERRLIAVCVGGALALAAAGAAAWRAWGPGTYVRARTMFGRARIYEVADDAGDPVRLLEVGGIVQSGTYTDDRWPDLVFEYLKKYDVLFQEVATVRRVCVLGCGGYDYPEHLLAHHAPIAVDAVEIDPAVTSLARRYFFLDRAIEEFVEAPIALGAAPGGPEVNELNLICADALEHLRSAGPSYDAVVNDAFDAGTPPAHLTTREFVQAAHDRLRPGGVYLTNIVSPLSGPGTAFLDRQVALLQDVFGNARVMPCDPDSLTSPDNVIVMARRHA